MNKAGTAIAILLSLTLSAAPLQATTIQSFSFEQLTEYAGLIFHGRVIDSRSDEDPADGLVYTWVRFEVDEVLKGAHPGGQLELRFVGGETADRKVSVAEMRIPATGEAGIYFVESLDTPLVNPLLGWSQGHFVLERDSAGNETVTRVDGQDPTGLIRESTALEDKLEGLQQGRSAPRSRAALLDEGLDIEAFKQAIRDSLEQPAR